MDIAVLGPLEVRDDRGLPVVVPPGGPTRLLELLVLEAGRPVTSTRIIEALWAEPPASAANLVHGYVSRLRRTLGADRIESTGYGYRLVVRDREVDVDRFRADLAGGLLRPALEHWRGAALAEVADLPWAVDAAATLERTRLDTVERVLAEDAARGRPGVIAELEQLVEEHPFRERLWAALVLALYGGGRQADALATYQRARARLVDELGVEPGPELRDAERRVLEHDPDLAPARGPGGSFPAPAGRIVGRDRELAAINAALARHRLVTLVGPGGAGKTTLAIAVGGARAETSWFVDLASLSDADEVPDAIARAIGVRPTDGDAADAVSAYLGQRSALLVLDNCEHVIESVAAVVRRLLGDCAGLRLLTTSRAPLAVTGERVEPISGLDGDAAVRLIADLAAASGADVRSGSPALRELCVALDRLPLALELAAPGLVTMTVPELLASVREGGSAIPERRGDERHRNLASVVDWGVALLEPADRQGLAALTLFRSPFEAASADAVAAVQPGIAGRLVQRSLLGRDADVDDRARFRLLETVRAQQPRPDPGAVERYVAHHLDLAEQAEQGLRSPGSPEWMRRVRASVADFRGAVEAALEADRDSAARLVAALYWPWFLDGQLDELQDWAETALSSGVTDARLAARLWWAVSATRIARGDLDGSETAAQHQIAYAHESSDRELEALGHSLLGMAAWARGDLVDSRRHHTTALSGAADGEWTTALVAALAARASGDPDELAVAEQLAVRTGEPMVIASCRDYSGSAAISTGDHAVAAVLAARALAGYEAVGYQEGIASAHALAGAAAAGAGNWPVAQGHFEEALDVCRRLGHRGGVATAWDGLGIVAANTGRPADAATLLARADVERAAIGAAVAPALALLRQSAQSAL